MVDWKRPNPILTPPPRDPPKARDWVVNSVHVGNVLNDSAQHTPRAPTTYHSPHIARTIMGGPGNRSRIMECSCGANFDSDHTYVGRERRRSDWYAAHAGIAGGGEAVATILRQYDEALDVKRYPDHPHMQGKTAGDPTAILRQLRKD